MTVETSLGDVLDDIQTGKSFQTSEILARPDEFGVLKVSGISWSQFRDEEAKALMRDYTPAESHRVKQGDLLISRANTKELVGAVVLVERDYPFRLLSDKTLRLVLDEGRIHKEYLLFALRSSQARAHIEHFATGTSDSMRNISQDVIKAIPLRLPPLPEQRQIAARLKAQLAEVFLRVCLDQRLSEINGLVPILNDEEFGMFLEVLSTPDYLNVFIVRNELVEIVGKRLEEYSAPLDEFSAARLFLKRILAINLSEADRNYASENIAKFRGERKMDWGLHKVALRYALLSYAVDANSFASFANNRTSKHRYYFDELGLYAALFTSCIQIIQNTTTLVSAIRDFLGFLRKVTMIQGQYLGNEVSELWAKIFFYSDADIVRKKSLSGRRRRRSRSAWCVV